MVRAFIWRKYLNLLKWLFGRQSIGGIVFSITKMRRKLEKAMEDANTEIEDREVKIIGADTKKDKAIEKAKSKFAKAEAKERKEIDCAIDEIGEARAWLGALPSIGEKKEPVVPELEGFDGDDSEEHS